MSPLDRLDWLEHVASDPGLPAAALRVAMVIAGHVRRDGRAIIPAPDLEAAAAAPRNTLKRALRALETGGWIVVKVGRGRGNAKSFTPAIPAYINGQKGPAMDPFTGEFATEKRAQKRAQKRAH